jgi:uncharacterized protein YdaU (DUF1376 family)
MYYYQHHIGDYRKDTSHLSLLEHGIYRQLLDLYYITEKPLDKKSIRLIGARTDQEIAMAELILNEFFEKKGTKYFHKRCDDEIQNYKLKSKSASESSKKRWNNIKNLQDANAMPTQSERNANQEPITKNQKPIKSKIADDFKVSDYVKDWAIKNKYDLKMIEKHKNYFITACKANSYIKDNWDDYFIKAIVDNWLGSSNPKGGCSL